MTARTNLVAVGSGLLFGAGLAVSGLTRPQVVIGFLDVTGRWDPTLGVVMVVATAVNAAFTALAMRRRRPLCAESLSLPAPGPIDRRLLAGAASSASVGGSRKAIRKAIGKADLALGTARRLVNKARKKGVIPEGCAAEAFDLIDGLRQRAREARQSLKS